MKYRLTADEREEIRNIISPMPAVDGILEAVQYMIDKAFEKRDADLRGRVRDLQHADLEIKNEQDTCAADKP